MVVATSYDLILTQIFGDVIRIMQLLGDMLLQKEQYSKSLVALAFIWLLMLLA